MVRTLLSTPQKLAPPANFSIYFTPIGSSRVENGANPFRWLESMTDLSYIGWICEPRLIGNAKEISRTDPPRKELDDFSSRNEQRKDESDPEWINARTDRSGQTWPNRFATSKNRESRMLWSARGIANQVLSKATRTKSYSIVHTLISLSMYNLSLEDEASLREKMLSSTFHPVFFLPILFAQERKLCHHKGGRKETNAFLIEERKIYLGLKLAEYKRSKDPRLLPGTLFLSPIIREDRNYSEFLSRKAELGEGRVDPRGREHPYFSVKYHRDQVLMLRVGHGPEDIKFARTVSDEGSAARGTTSNIRKRALVKAERRCYRNRSILASPRATIPWCRMPPGIPRGKLR